MAISVIPTGDYAAALGELKTAVEGFDTNIGLIKTETDKVPATIDKVDLIKVETDKVPDMKTEIDKIPDIKTDTDKTDATIAKVDLNVAALALRVLETTPANDATAVAQEATVTVVFDRNVKEYIDNTDLLTKISVTDPTPTTYTLTSATITDDTLVVVIDGDLALDKVVTFALSAAGVSAQNNNGKLAEDLEISFTTVTE